MKERRGRRRKGAEVGEGGGERKSFLRFQIFFFENMFSDLLEGREWREGNGRGDDAFGKS